MEPSTTEPRAARQQEIREKRLATLVGAYNFLAERFSLIRNGSHLHDGLVAQTVEHYIQDRKALCGRLNITGRIQRHKIAGLMAGAILKNKPIIPNTTRLDAGLDNEMLAAYHGIAVCAENELAGLATLIQSEHYKKWEGDLFHLFRRRPDDTDSFMMVFETLSLTYFPKNLQVDD